MSIIWFLDRIYLQLFCDLRRTSFFARYSLHNEVHIIGLAKLFVFIRIVFGVSLRMCALSRDSPDLLLLFLVLLYSRLEAHHIVKIALQLCVPLLSLSLLPSNLVLQYKLRNFILICFLLFLFDFIFGMKALV